MIMWFRAYITGSWNMKIYLEKIYSWEELLIVAEAL